MMTASTATAKGQLLSICAASLAFSFASLGFIQKHGGLASVVGYLIAVFIACLVVRGMLGKFFPVFSKWRLSLSVLFVLLATIAFAVVYPIENSQGLGKGSDRDDGLNIAVSRLLEGETPYYPPHPMAGPLSVLPGSIFLATPFALLGNSAWQNIFWIAALLAALREHVRAQFAMLAMLTLAMVLSPAFQYEWISGGDLIANGIFLSLSVWLVLRVWLKEGQSPLMIAAACLFLGLALSSRLNELMLLPLIGGALWALAGFQKAVIATTLSLTVTAFVSIPFYLHDPEAFTPLIAGNKLLILRASFPYAEEFVKGSTGLFALVCGVGLITRRILPTPANVFLLAAAITALPMILAVAIISFSSGGPDFSFLHPRYGLLYLIPGFLGIALKLHPEEVWNQTPAS